MELSNDDWRPIGWIIFVVAALFLLRAWINFFLTQRFSCMDAMNGVSTVKSLASDIMRPMAPAAPAPAPVLPAIPAAGSAGFGGCFLGPMVSSMFSSAGGLISQSLLRINQQQATMPSMVANRAARVTQLLGPYRRGKR